MYQSQLPSGGEPEDYDDLFGSSYDGDFGTMNNSSSLNRQKGGLTFPPQSTPATTGPSSGFGGSGGLCPNSLFFIDPSRKSIFDPPNTSGLTSSGPGAPTPSGLHDSWADNKAYYASVLNRVAGLMNKEEDLARNQSATPAAGETGQTNPQAQEHDVFNGTEELKASPRQGNAAARGGDPDDDGGSDDEGDKGGKKDSNAEGRNHGNKGEADGKRDNGNKPTELNNRENNGSGNGGNNEEISNTTVETQTTRTQQREQQRQKQQRWWKQRRAPTPTPAQIRMGEGWTMSDQTYEQQPLKKRRKTDVPYPQLINHTFRSMNGLSTLQIAHNAPISLSALDVVCEHLWKALHSDVRAQICVPPPNGPSLWSGDQVDVNRMYEKMELPGYRNKESKEYLFYRQIKSHPWVIWPLWVEDDFGKDYATVLLYSQESDQSKKPAVFDRPVQYTIIDPRRASKATKKPDAPADEPAKYGFPKARTDRLDKALKNFLNHAGYDLSCVLERQAPVNASRGPAPADTRGNLARGMEDMLMGDAPDSGD
ncbi:hypothetical protein DL766_002994 [Monosporascus sp. MC13-8B]|uniref:Uncharacterized protein n=1 Tax=Monosporascus cannonballus TaxID=155416 RepID=A0ABY0HHT2_9PEZI|nr:hypothetical protein DL762_000960 [Monosporascus cannonballus]RYP34473.1 hypothetical protein DL766_002994 [Monosporascus sp. MC13-8B]